MKPKFGGADHEEEDAHDALHVDCAVHVLVQDLLPKDCSNGVDGAPGSPPDHERARGPLGPRATDYAGARILSRLHRGAHERDFQQQFCVHDSHARCETVRIGPKTLCGGRVASTRAAPFRAV